MGCACAAFNEPSSPTETDHPAPARYWSALRSLFSVQFFVQPCPCLVGSLDPLSPVSGSYGRVLRCLWPSPEEGVASGVGFGIAATVISALFNTTLTTVGPCALDVSGSGFPLPWYLTFTHYTGLDGPPCALSPDLTTYWRTFAFFSFPFDTIFYAGLAMSRNEIYAWFKGSGLQSQGRLPASPKENA